MNRDTTWAAVGITYTHTRPISLFALRSDYAFEIHTYDIAHRKGPRRIVRWVYDGNESPWIVGWDDSGLIVARGPRDAMKPMRVDPVTGASRPMNLVPAKSLKEWSESLNGPWGDQNRTHIAGRSEGYFLWNARTRQWEFLFPSPTEPGEPPNAYRAELAVRDRYADTIHRIWQVSTRQMADNARFLVKTYVPRPGTGSRAYLVSLTIELPDTSREVERIYADQWVPLAAQEIIVGPGATTLEIPISNQRLRELIIPYRRSIHRPTWSKAVTPRVRVKLQPVLLPGDAAKLPPAYPTSSEEDTQVAIPVPSHWITRGP